MKGQMSWFEGSQPFQVTKPIRLIELFAGVGSQAKALERLGVNFEHYKVCEFDKYPMASYNAIHDTSFNVSDIQKITAEDLNICDTNKYTYILTYSFPCQDLSYAGKQSGMAKGDNTRSGLLWEVERILKECKELPQILLMENVPAVCGQKNIKDFQQWISFLESIGYKSKYQILNAKNYEVPQNRDRCFMVSWLGDFYYEFPEPIPLSRRIKDVLEENVDEKYYLSDRVVERLIRSQNVQVERERERERAVKQSVAADEESSTLITDGTLSLNTAKIMFVGSLSPTNSFPDRMGILSTKGICQTLKATDYKDPQKIAVKKRLRQ